MSPRIIYNDNDVNLLAKIMKAEALGEGDEGDLDALHRADGIALIALEVLVIGVNAHRLHAGTANPPDGGDQTGHALVDGIGIGQLHQIHAAIRQRLRQRLGGRMAVAIGLAGEHALKIHSCHIRLSQQVTHIQE